MTTVRRSIRAGLLAVLLLTLLGPTAAPATTTDPEVIDALDREGRFLSVAAGADLSRAIDRANRAGVAFAWLDQAGDETVALTLADRYTQALGERNSPYHTVLLVVANGYGASSLVWSQTELDRGLDAAFDGFDSGSFGVGVDAFTDALATVGTASTPSTTTGSGTTADGGSGGGIGIGTILLVLVVAGGGLLGIRSLLRRRRAREQAAIDLAEDRAEIEEQLKNNADRVMELGDRVIARGDRELIVMYEEATAAYQDVSQRIDEADSAEEIDELDDRIDQAEWQFEVIEASLDGRPRPRPPTPTDGLPPTPDPPATRPPATSPRTGRTYPTTAGGSRRSRSGGGLGGVLTDIVLGGGLGGLGGALGGSRRTRRRVDRRGGSGSGSGGLGGGVLRRGGSGSPSRPSGRSRATRSSGGRSLGGGRTRSRGGRRL